MAKLSVIVPVFNEERQLARVIHALMKSPCPIEREWIFVDDKSSDSSLKILEELARQYSFRLIPQATNPGKGSAVIRGIAEATGDFIMIA